MKDRSIYFVLSCFFFFIFYINLSLFQKSLNLNHYLSESSEKKIQLESGSITRANLEFLSLGLRYMAVLKGNVQSSNLQSYRVPFFRDAMPNLLGRVNYRIQVGSEDLTSSSTFSSTLIDRISNTVSKSSSGNFLLVLPLTDLVTSSKEDFIELEVVNEVGEVSGAYLEIYRVKSLHDFLLFYPIILVLGCFIMIQFAIGFSIIGVLGLPRANSFYSVFMSLLFGLFGFDSLIKGQNNRFILKLFTIGGFGILYAFDLGKEFYGLIFNKS